MKQFTDAEGRKWDVVVNVGIAKAVKDLTAVDIFKLHSDEAERVFSDPCLLVNVVYVVCKQQADKRDVTDVQFGEAMVGDVLEQAAEALLGAVSDVFPSSRRQLLEKQMAKANELTAVVLKKANLTLDSLDVNSLLLNRSTK